MHRAVLRDGTPVVVKVQYPEVARLARVDLAAMRTVGGFARHMVRSPRCQVRSLPSLPMVQPSA